MINVYTDKESTLSFNINIEGNKSTPEARLILNLESGISLSLKARLQDKTAKITVPPLKHLLKNSDSKVVTSFLEVIADDNYYVPWKDTCELKESISVNVNDNVSIEEKTDKITVTAKVTQAPIEESKSLFKDTVTKNKLSEEWNKYKKLVESNDPKSNNEYNKGYFSSLDSIIKLIKKDINTLTNEEMNTLLRTKLKEAIALKDKATNKEEINFSDGFYNSIVDHLSLIQYK